VARILVVDDNAEVREVLATMLRIEGYEVTVAADGKEGLARYAALRPALVIADIFMPEMDGVGMIREIRREFPEARIIAISAGWNVPNLQVSAELAAHDVLALAKSVGADHVLAKPLDPDVLVAAVAAVLSGATTA
jgi:CheY-like chemotaxis protein